MLTPEGYKPIEELKAGDLVLSRDEHDVNAPVEAKVIEEHFTRVGTLLNVHVGGEVIQTTPEHPFYVKDKGWTPAAELEIGDLLSTHEGDWIAVDDLFDNGEESVVYNFRVAEYHTYFVAPDSLEFGVWVHNAYKIQIGTPPAPEAYSRVGRGVGILAWEDAGETKWVRLVSGEKNAKKAGLSYTVAGDNAVNYHHLEAQARKVMLLENVTRSRLVINLADICDSCAPVTHPHLLGDALPRNSILEVWSYRREKMKFIREIEGQL